MIPSLLQRYVLREMIAVVAVSAVALTAIFFIGLSVSYARDGLSIIQLYYVIPYVLMLSLPYALPASFLLGSVLVFGRLSARFELDAMRASGVNLYHVALAPLVLALAVCGGTFFMNHYLFPWTMYKVKDMQARLMRDLAQRYASSATPMYEVKPYLIYIGGKDSQDQSWKNVMLVEFGRNEVFGSGEIPIKILVAKKGFWRFTDSRTAALRLLEGDILEPRLSGGGQPPMGSFREMDVRIPLTAGGGPNLDRPKFRTLGPLLKDIRERGEAAEVVLSQLPGAVHARSTEWKSRADLRAAGEEFAARSDEWAAKKKALDAASAAVAKEETDTRAAQAAWENASKQLQDAKAALAGKPEYLEKLKNEIKRAHAEGDSAEYIEVLEGERKKSAADVTKLTKGIAEAEKELQSTAAVLQAAAARLQTEQQNCAKVQAACDSAEAVRLTAEKVRDQIRTTVSRLKTVQRWIEAKSEFHFRNAGAMTCFVFTLIGIPLGIFARRGTVLVALAISFAAVLLVHYPLFMVGDSLADHGYLAPWIANWLADAVMGSAGLALLLGGVKR